MCRPQRWSVEVLRLQHCIQGLLSEQGLLLQEVRQQSLTIAALQRALVHLSSSAPSGPPRTPAPPNSPAPPDTPTRAPPQNQTAPTDTPTPWDQTTTRQGWVPMASNNPGCTTPAAQDATTPPNTSCHVTGPAPAPAPGPPPRLEGLRDRLLKLSRRGSGGSLKGPKSPKGRTPTPQSLLSLCPSSSETRLGSGTPNKSFFLSSSSGCPSPSGTPKPQLFPSTSGTTPVSASASVSASSTPPAPASASLSVHSVDQLAAMVVHEEHRRSSTRLKVNCQNH